MLPKNTKIQQEITKENTSYRPLLLRAFVRSNHPEVFSGKAPFPENTSGRLLLICQKGFSDNSKYLQNIIVPYFQILGMEKKNVKKVLKNE